MPPSLLHMHTRPDGHHLPAALTQPGDLPPPIPFPERPANARTERPSQRTLQRWGREAALIDQAKLHAHADGVRLGYRQGWRWGVACGVLAGAVLATLAWSIYLSLAAPEVAPPSARPTVTTRL